ncbi:hypothetical protein HBI67_052100 [Parastagonospora nodorum]|nr:hypothetical protein HBI67_052100 [Parastagonospora nodorum]KAH6089291.1 hypothetical protein HBI66_027620 [Parastagonospora nodorum]
MTCAGLTYHPLTGVVYDSKEIFDLGYFLDRIYNSPTLPSIAEHVRVLSFNLPFDTMGSSAVLNWLGARGPEPHPSRRYPGDLGVAADMCRSLLEAYGSTTDVPMRKWFQVIVRLVRSCPNIGTIEVPPEWEEVRWYDNNFPNIDLTEAGQEKRQLGDGRWRFGKDPVVLQAADEDNFQVE